MSSVSRARRSDRRVTPLALLGGPAALSGAPPAGVFDWPIVTREDEQAVLAVLRARAMSAIAVTQAFEAELAEWFGMPHALCHVNGTAAVQAAMFAVGIGRGDEIICPSLTYWASAMPVFSLGGTVVFADVDPDTLCIDPDDIAHRITPRTKAIVIVHYMGRPCDMDRLLRISRRHRLALIEDFSHAQGSRYKGRLCGTFGDVAASSMMTGKPLVCGEGGVLLTRRRDIYERAVAFGHYERTIPTRWAGDQACITRRDLMSFRGIPLGGVKNRLNQMSAALGRVQLRHYARRIAEIDKAMTLFWDQLEDVPGIRSVRPPAGSGSTMGGWYYPHGLYRAEELDGLPIDRFAEALNAEGFPTTSLGVNRPLHLHPVLNEADIYRDGRPTRLAHSNRDVRQQSGSLPVTEATPRTCFSIPCFYRYRPAYIRACAAAIRKVVAHRQDLLAR